MKKTEGQPTPPKPVCRYCYCRFCLCNAKGPFFELTSEDIKEWYGDK